MTNHLAPLSLIVEAVNADEGQYDPKSCRQVTDIRLVAQADDARHYVVMGKTFRRVSAFEWVYAVEVTEDGVSCHSETSARNAEAICYMLADKSREVTA